MQVSNTVDPFAFIVILSLFGVALTAVAEERWFSRTGENTVASVRLQSSVFVQRYIDQQRLESLRSN